MKKTVTIKIGDFFFKFRNLLFPIIILILFLVRPPVDKILGVEFFEESKDYITIFITFLGLLLRALVIGFVYIKRGGLNKKVYADTLVQDGFFGMCRNPLYVGNLLIYFGVFLMHGDIWVIVFGNLFMLFVYHCIVAAEEFFLKQKFGVQFTNYCKQVPRWSFRLSKFNESTKGMYFHFKRVLLKDYTTITNTIIAITLIQFYEEIRFYPTIHYATSISIIVISIIFASSVRFAKKKKYLVDA